MGLFGKLFGNSHKGEVNDNQMDEAITLVSEVVEKILSLSKLNLSFDIDIDESDGMIINFFGEDEDILVVKEGQLLDAFQLYLKRVLQHQLPDEKITLTADCSDFRKKADQSLIDLADTLKEVVINKAKPVYFRALPPRDRKIIHQYLAEDGRVQSRSIGGGLYKKIKIYPARSQSQEAGA